MPIDQDDPGQDNPGEGSLDSAVEVFDESRQRLFGVAYRILGSVAEAEDIVQEAWLRWQQTDRSAVRNPAGFLTTVATRLSINVAESARSRRETYVGPWLPEPVDTEADPALGAEKAEALESATLLLLERLRPDQRAAYVLREAFGYSYDQIAEILEISNVNARQIVSRAKRGVLSDRSEPVDPGKHRELLSAFVAAARGGDLAQLERVLAADVVSLSDGAGVVATAARRPVVGRVPVAKFVRAFSSWWWDGTTTSWTETNGRPSLLIRRDGEPIALLSISASADGIERLMWVMVPEKLVRLGEPGR